MFVVRPDLEGFAFDVVGINLRVKVESLYEQEHHFIRVTIGKLTTSAAFSEWDDFDHVFDAEVAVTEKLARQMISEIQESN